MAPKDVPKSIADQGRVTIRTVAMDAGVSVAAVSKVLRNAYGVSDGLRAKVRDSMTRLNYRPRTAARGLRGRTFMIGVLLSDVQNPFLPQIISGVNDVLIPSHFQTLIGVGQAHLPMETALIESMIDHNMDGLVLVAPRLSSQVLAAFARQIPTVVIGYHNAGAERYDTVNSDDRRGAEIAVEALIAQGYRDIMMLSTEAEIGTAAAENATTVQWQREVGYESAMDRAGLTQAKRFHRIPNVTAADKPEIDRFLAAPDRPRAMFCWSDLDAVHVLSAAARLGLRVPQDLAVVGYDNSSVAALPQINLASVDQAGHQLGTVATQLLLERIEGRTEPRHILQEPHLVMRGSARSG